MPVGFDSPREQLEDDLLNRAPLARIVFDLCTNLPREWSVRVGVHGEWGSGKTTVLNFVRALLGDDHLTFNLNAWRFTSELEIKEALKAELTKLLPESERRFDVKCRCRPSSTEIEA